MSDKKEASVPSMMPDMSDLMTRLIKYAFEGVAVALAAYFFSGKLKINEIGMISLTAMATFAILDVYAPSVGASARTGAGFGIGAGLVGFPA
jgi:ABC-type Co2+ transport system permease subunit